VGLAAPSQELHPALGLRPRFSALRASFGSLFQQSSFPQYIEVLIKTLVVPIFGAKECIGMQDFVFKIYKKNPGSPRRKGRDLFAPTPVLTCQILVPLRFF